MTQTRDTKSACPVFILSPLFFFPIVLYLLILTHLVNHLFSYQFLSSLKPWIKISSSNTHKTKIPGSKSCAGEGESMPNIWHRGASDRQREIRLFYPSSSPLFSCWTGTAFLFPTALCTPSSTLVILTFEIVLINSFMKLHHALSQWSSK